MCRLEAKTCSASCSAGAPLPLLRPTNGIFACFLISICDAGEFFGELPQLFHVGLAASQPGNSGECDSASGSFVEAARAVVLGTLGIRRYRRVERRLDAFIHVEPQEWHPSPGQSGEPRLQCR